jgi:hypothetical protein
MWLIAIYKNKSYTQLLFQKKNKIKWLAMTSPKVVRIEQCKPHRVWPQQGMKKC